jgi:hypothetical protein
MSEKQTNHCIYLIRLRYVRLTYWLLKYNWNLAQAKKDFQLFQNKLFHFFMLQKVSN